MSKTKTTYRKATLLALLALLLGSGSYYLHQQHSSPKSPESNSKQATATENTVTTEASDTNLDGQATANAKTVAASSSEQANSAHDSNTTESTTPDSNSQSPAVVEDSETTSSPTDEESKKLSAAEQAIKQAKITEQLASLPNLYIKQTNKDGSLDYRQFCTAIATVANTYIYDFDFNKGAFITYNNGEDACNDDSLSPEFKQQCNLIKGSITSLQKPVVDPIPGKLLPYAYLEGDNLGYRIFIPTPDLSAYKTINTSDGELYLAEDNKATEKLFFNFYKGYQGKNAQVDILSSEEIQELQSSNSLEGFKFIPQQNYKLEVLSAVLDHAYNCTLDVVPVAIPASGAAGTPRVPSESK